MQAWDYRTGERMRMLCNSTEAIEAEFKKGSRERESEIKLLRAELSTLKAALDSVCCCAAHLRTQTPQRPCNREITAARRS
jgi:hypothetical protein